MVMKLMDLVIQTRLVKMIHKLIVHKCLYINYKFLLAYFFGHRFVKSSDSQAKDTFNGF